MKFSPGRIASYPVILLIAASLVLPAVSGEPAASYTDDVEAAGLCSYIEIEWLPGSNTVELTNHSSSTSFTSAFTDRSGLELQVGEEEWDGSCAPGSSVVLHVPGYTSGRFVLEISCVGGSSVSGILVVG